LNPYYAGANQSGSIALDGLAAIPPGVYSPNTTSQYLDPTSALQIGLTPGGAITMDPRLMALISATSTTMSSHRALWPVPPAPILGRLNADGSFPGLYLYRPPPAPPPGQPAPLPGPPPAQTVATGELVFGWAGADA